MPNLANTRVRLVPRPDTPEPDAPANVWHAFHDRLGARDVLMRCRRAAWGADPAAVRSAREDLAEQDVDDLDAIAFAAGRVERAARKMIALDRLRTVEGELVARGHATWVVDPTHRVVHWRHRDGEGYGRVLAGSIHQHGITDIGLWPTIQFPDGTASVLNPGLATITPAGDEGRAAFATAILDDEQAQRRREAIA